MMRIFASAALFALVSLEALVALDVPELRGRVNDNASMLSDDARLRITQKLKAFEETDSTQLVVLTINSLEDDNLEDFSIRVVNEWKIGQTGKDNGAIFIISKDDRKLRIEVGYGLEGVLTDLVSGRIIRNVVAPEFKVNNYEAGIEKGVDAIIAAVQGEFTQNAADANDEEADWRSILVALISLFVVFIISKFLPSDGGSRGSFGGSSGSGSGSGRGGGSFSGGGGRFGGGGASGGW